MQSTLDALRYIVTTIYVLALDRRAGARATVAVS
jgi:hypothetical protein